MARTHQKQQQKRKNREEKQAEGNECRGLGVVAREKEKGKQLPLQLQGEGSRSVSRGRTSKLSEGEEHDEGEREASWPSSLPLDVISDILSRLPPKVLLVFRAVCKSWRDLIGSDHFAHRLHLDRCRKSHNLLLCSYERRNLHHSQDTVPPLEDEFPLPYSFTKGLDSVLFTSSCNGLVCFMQERCHDTSAVIVVNPATRDVLELPAVSGFLCYGTICQLLYQPLSAVGTMGSYKVLFRPWSVLDSAPTVVFTLGEDVSWRSIHDPFRQWRKAFPGTESPCVNGAVHFLYQSLPPRELTLVVVAFDVANEKFFNLGFPSASSTIVRQGSVVAESQGRLLLLQLNASFTVLDVWLLQDYANRAWTKVHSIELGFLHRAGAPITHARILASVKTGDDEHLLQMCCHDNMPGYFCPSLIYNFRLRTLTRRKLLGGDGSDASDWDVWRWGGNYVQSMVSLNAFKRRESTERKYRIKPDLEKGVVDGAGAYPKRRRWSHSKYTLQTRKLLIQTSDHTEPKQGSC